MALKEKNYWLETVAEAPTEAAAPLPEKADVAVIGAGITGLAAARALAKRGASVVVLEAETVGWGASSRNGGMVLTGLKLGLEAVVRRYGLPAARRMFAASVASVDCVEQVVTEEQLDCDFARSGHLAAAFKPAHFRDFVAYAGMLARDFDHAVRVVPRSELRGEIGSDAYFGGLVDETSAGVNPARYVAGLGQAAGRAGAQVCEHTRVEAVERADDGQGARVRTSRGRLFARHVLAGTSGYTGAATPALRRRIVPIGSYIIVTEPLSEDLARDVSPRDRMIFDSKNFLYYFRLTPDRRMLFGGRAGFLPETANTVRESGEILRRGLERVYPQLRGVKVEYVWGGTLDFAFDMMPHAGALDGIHYALGYAGHGVGLATYLGTQVGRALAGEPVDNPFAERNLPGAPFGLYDGRPWFLPLAGLWYKLLDWLT